MDELQQKIEAAEKEKVGIDTSQLATVEKKLVEEAEIGIQHAKKFRDHEKEIKKWKVGDVINDKKIRHAKLRFEKMKLDFPAWLWLSIFL